MTHYQRLLITLGIIFASLAFGYIAQCLHNFGTWRISQNNFAKIRKTLQKAAIFFLMPASAMLSLWGLVKPGTTLLILPIVGTFSYVTGGWLALKAGRLQNLSPAQLGSYYGCGTFANLGAVGGLVCLIFIGEETIALVALYRLLEEIYFFGVAFPVARSFAAGTAHIKLSLKQFKPHPGIGVIVLALACGIILNLSGVDRPSVLTPFASACMIAATIFLLTGIGMNLRLAATSRYLKPAIIMCLIKFICQPFIITGLAMCLGSGYLEGGVMLKTIFILSAMPVAMYALVPPSLFDLDSDLANTCWIVSTLALIIVIPVLIVLLPHI